MVRTLSLILVAVSLSLAGCNDRSNFYTGETIQKPADPYLQITKGMPEAKVIELLGEPESRYDMQDPNQGNITQLKWKSKGITVVIGGGIVRQHMRQR